MKKKFLSRCLALALAGCMAFTTSVFAAAPDEEVPTGVEVESFMEEMQTEDAPEVLEEEADIPSSVAGADVEEVGQDDIIIEESEDLTADSNGEEGIATVDTMEAFEMPVDAEVDAPVGQIADEELVGAIPVVSLGTVYSFSCTKGTSEPSYQFYQYKASSTGVYRVDVTNSKGRMNSSVLLEQNDTLYGVDIHGLYVNNDMKYTVQLESGKTYYFAVYPNTNRTDSGKFKLRKVTKQIKSSTISYYTNKSFYVGPKGDGEWDVNEDGSKNLNVWLFSIDELYSIVEKIEITFTDGSKTTWTPSNGAEVGSTGILVIPEQITDGWKLDQKAYMNVYLGDKVTTNKIQIPYKDPLFTDVRDESHPYYTAIYWAANKGITKGYSDGSFGINKPCTRGHAVQFLWKMAKSPEPKAVSQSPFPDVPKTHAYYKAVLWAQQKGIAKGYTSGANKGKFGIDDTCTRGQIMSFIWRYKGKPAPKAVSASPFSDVPTSHVYYKAVLWGSQNGVTKGYTTGPKAGQFGVDDNCTRGQIVKFLYNIR